MLPTALLVAHIAVLGYWLGSELVINHTFRYVSWSAGMPFNERSRLMDHVMDVDQHVRYALVLQAGLGTALALLYGYIPGGEGLLWVVLAATVVWLTYVELAHRLRSGPVGARLAAIDRGSRYVLLAILICAGGYGLMNDTDMPRWLAWKLAAFAGVVSCGLGIRFALIDYFRLWQRLKAEGSTPEAELALRFSYVKATSVLVLLWVFIGVIVYLSVWKPV